MNVLSKIRKKARGPEFPSIIILFVMVLINFLLQTSFFKTSVLNLNIETFTPLILVSMSQAIIIIAGGLDLSVGAGVSVLNCLLAVLMKDSATSSIFALVAVLLVALMMGAVNGFLAGYLKLSPMIATFATSAIWSGIALFIMPQPGGYIPPEAMEFFSLNISIISVPLVIIVLGLLLWFAIKKKKIGKYMYAVGSNEESAYANGINVKAIKLTSYIIAYIFVFLAAISITFQTSSGDANLGVAYTLNSVAAVVIGGISLKGGKGKVYGAVIGALILSLVENIIYFANIPSTYEQFTQGLIVVFALGMSIIYKKREQKSIL